MVLLGLLFTFAGLFAQVGIGTIHPKATLDIHGSPSKTAITDGLLPPRLLRSELISKTGYTASQTGAIIYITDLSGENNTQTVNVTAVGYFYFDGSAWHRIIYDNEFGDIKQSLKNTDHSGWIHLNGRTISSLSITQEMQAIALGFTGNLPNANDAFLVQNNNPLGSVTSSNHKTISQANLPDIEFKGDTNLTSTGDQWLSKVQNFPGESGYNSVTITKTRGSSGLFSSKITNGYDDDPNEMTSTYTETDHSHAISINSGGGNVALNVTPKSLSVNTFIYLGN